MAESEPFGPLPPPLLVPVTGPLRGPRVILARYDEEDLSQLQDVIDANIDHLAPTMRWIAQEPKTIAERRTLVNGWNRDADQGRGVVLGCFLDDQLIGSTGLHRRRPHAASLEIGYWLDRRHVGHGYATELSLLLTEEAFSHEEIDQVSIYCDDANENSAAVADRAGFTYVDTQQSPQGPLAPGESGRERHFVLSINNFNPEWRRLF